jgi:hypothetical protein
MKITTKTRISKLLVSIALVAGSGSISASDQCESWGCISSISVLYVRAEGNTLVGTPLDETLANCTPVSGKYFSLNPAAGNAKEIYSALLASYMSGKKIQLRVVEGSGQCELSYVRFSSSF